MSQNEISLGDAARRLFDIKWLCEMPKVCLTLMFDTPNFNDEDKVIENFDPRVGSYLHATGVVRTEVCHNLNGLLELVNGTSRMSVGEEYYAAIEATPIEMIWLSTAQIADLMAKYASITIVNPTDVVKIYDYLVTYINLVEEAKIYRPAYKPPPDKDMKTLISLKEMVRDKAELFKDKTFEKTGFDLLQDLLLGQTGTTASSQALAQNKTTLHAIINDTRVGPSTDRVSSPYSFTNSPRSIRDLQR